jgi:hypothetical protein
LQANPISLIKSSLVFCVGGLGLLLRLLILLGSISVFTILFQDPNYRQAKSQLFAVFMLGGDETVKH